MMRSAILCGVVLAVMTGCATTGDGGRWTCAADGMQSGSYDGSEYANIHLRGYSYGGRYKVEKNADGTEAKGTTRDGTPFVCKKSG